MPTTIVPLETAVTVNSVPVIDPVNTAVGELHVWLASNEGETEVTVPLAAERVVKAPVDGVVFPMAAGAAKLTRALSKTPEVIAEAAWVWLPSENCPADVPNAPASTMPPVPVLSGSPLVVPTRPAFVMLPCVWVVGVLASLSLASSPAQTVLAALPTVTEIAGVVPPEETIGAVPVTDVTPDDGAAPHSGMPPALTLRICPAAPIGNRSPVDAPR